MYGFLSVDEDLGTSRDDSELDGAEECDLDVSACKPKPMLNKAARSRSEFFQWYQRGCMNVGFRSGFSGLSREQRATLDSRRYYVSV